MPRTYVLLASVALLSGCAASIPPVQVTRFHLAGDIARDTIAPVAGSTTSLERSAYDAAVQRELGRLGFRPVGESDPARYVFSTEVTRDARDAAPRRSPISIGIGGGTGGYGGGVGLGASFGLGGNKSRQIVVTRLSVQIRERGGSTVWEGRAETAAPTNAPASQPGIAADKLAAALFRDFPGVSGRTITVP